MRGGQQLQAQLTASQQQTSRLQQAIKYTVNSDLLFAPGSWQMRPQGEQIIADFAKKLAPTQQNHLLVSGYTDNAPIGPASHQTKNYLKNEPPLSCSISSRRE